MRLIDFKETKKILKKYNLALEKTELFNSKEEAFLFANKIGFPVALKIYSDKTIHKTEKKALFINVEESDFESKFNFLNEKFKDKEGIIVQKMFEGEELIIGTKRDDIFNEIIMVGIGGIFAEVLKDVSFGVCPITKKDAKKMISSLKGEKILNGYRGREKCNVDKLIETLINVSDLFLNEKEIESIDFNPVIINSKDIYLADVRIIKC